MKKIMFNDRYGLTQAVLEGRKTMTRRIVPIDLYNQTDWKAVAEGDREAVVDGEGYYHDIRNCGKYRVGEEVAIAQSYETLANSRYCSELGMMDSPTTFKKEFCGNGWGNKMFVKAEYMPHRIRITNIKMERLQDISEEDCLREGIKKMEEGIPYRFDEDNGKIHLSADLRMLFADLIDRISGRGTWERNPWVFVYEFELVK